MSAGCVEFGTVILPGDVDISPDPVILNSGFSVKCCFKPVTVKLQSPDPVRRMSHNVRDGLHRCVFRRFDDYFVVYVPDDPVPAEILHRVRQQVSADGLNDVFHYFRAVGFHAAPVLLRVCTEIGDAFAAELVFFQHRLEINQMTTGGKGDEEGTGAVGENKSGE